VGVSPLICRVSLDVFRELLTCELCKPVVMKSLSMKIALRPFLVMSLALVDGRVIPFDSEFFSCDFLSVRL